MLLLILRFRSCSSSLHFTIIKLLLFTTPPRRRMLMALLAPVLFLALLAPLLADKLDFDVDQVREP